MAARTSEGLGGARGVIRLLNTAGGGVLCLAGEIDEPVVESFLCRYGREPVRVDAIDARSATSLSRRAQELVQDHVDAAARRGRRLSIRLPAAPPDP